jgi:RNA polymerase sigma-70 factor, ECF subfamily
MASLEEDGAARDGSDDTDRLISEARAGHPQALTRLLQQYERKLLSLAHRKLPPSLRATYAPSDVLQDTFAKAHERFHQFKGTDAARFGAWLRRILVNSIRSQQRRLRSRKRRPNEGAGRRRGSPRLANLIDTITSPSGAAQTAEERARLMAGLEQLSPDDREVLLLRHRDQLSFREVGERLKSVTRGPVHQRHGEGI